MLMKEQCMGGGITNWHLGGTWLVDAGVNFGDKGEIEKQPINVEP